MYFKIGEEMEDKGRIKIVSGIDVSIAVLFFIIGILVIIFGVGLLDSTLNQSAPFWAWSFILFIIVLGLTSIVYGIKRIIDNIYKFQEASYQERYQPPIRQPPIEPPEHFS